MDPEPYSQPDALARIMDLAAPGQALSISEAIEVLCDIWNIARRTIEATEPKPQGY